MTLFLSAIPYCLVLISHNIDDQFLCYFTFILERHISPKYLNNIFGRQVKRVEYYLRLTSKKQ